MFTCYATSSKKVSCFRLLLVNSKRQSLGIIGFARSDVVMLYTVEKLMLMMMMPCYAGALRRSLA